MLSGLAMITDTVRVFGNIIITDRVEVYGSVKIEGNTAGISGNIRIG